MLDREEEAKRQYEYAQNQQYNARMGGQQQSFIGTAPVAEISAMPDMNDLPGPHVNKRRMGGPAAREEEEEVWDTAALLD